MKFKNRHIDLKVTVLFILSLFVLTNKFNFPRSDSSVTEPDSSNILYRIILIGDAGESVEDKEDPILSALTNEALKVESTLVIFLGDNIYPVGLPPEGAAGREIYQGYIDREIKAVVDAKAMGLFIPGNHDWNNDDENGWNQIKRQADYVSKFNDHNILFYPMNGCPGPDILDFGSNIRIIILDTQWWLREEGERPEQTDSICNECDEVYVINRLDSILNISNDKFVILAAHHPLSTHGPHGGYFSIIDHIFPLTNLSKYLWLPLPFIGSLYPLIRGMGVSKQDLSSDEYRNMKEKIESVVTKHPGVVVVSGHEHALQILGGPAENIYLVSGAGVWEGVEESLTEGDDTIFKGRYEGFMNIDFVDNGRVRLSVIRVLDENGNHKEVYSMWLEK
jgi:hypothetical protein